MAITHCIANFAIRRIFIIERHLRICSNLHLMLHFAGTLQKHKWENAMTLDKSSWGFRREMNLADVLSVHDLLTLLAETVR